PTMTTRPHFATASPYGDLVAYDMLGRRISITHGDGTASSTVYDGLKVHETDEVGHQQTLVYDERGRVVHSEQVRAITAPCPACKPEVLIATSDYAYWPLSGVHTIKDTEGNTITHDFDARGRRIRVTDPDAGITQVTYDAFGNVVKSTDGAGRNSYFF